MKKVIFILMFINLTFLLRAQRFVYSYDQAGNRTERMYMLSRMSGEADTTKEYAQKINDNKIAVLPNPTRGRLSVKIDNLKSEQKATVMLFDEKGMLLSKMENASEISYIDISQKPAGVYILKVYIDKNKKEWKILRIE